MLGEGSDMEVIDPTRVLSNDLVIDGVDNHLYRIGLCLENNDKENKKRKFIHKPIIVSSVCLLFLFKCIINLFISDSKYMPIFGIFSEMRIYFNVMVILMTSFAI